MPSNDPEYQKKYYPKWYKENREKHIKACGKRRDAQTVENQKRIIAYLKEHPCVDCGETDIVVLQFDHVRGNKRIEISKMLQFSWKSIEAEIDKCVVRCANDHTRKTARERGHYKVLGS